MDDDEFPLKIAVDRAWTVHLATHDDIEAADYRRCSLERYLSGKRQAGESDPDELTCHGLSGTLRKVPAGTRCCWGESLTLNP